MNTAVTIEAKKTTGCECKSSIACGNIDELIHTCRKLHFANFIGV